MNTPSTGTTRRMKILAALTRAGGGVKSSSGKARAELMRLVDIDDMSPQAVSTLLGQMDKDGLIVRHVNAKQCYEIIVGDVPENWKSHIAILVERDTPVEAPAAAEEEEEQAPLAPGAPLPRNSVVIQEHVDHAELAAEILKQAIDAALAPQQTAVDRRRLSDTLEENGRLRSKLAVAEDTIRSLTSERDGLRQQKHTIQSNLDKALKDNGKVVDGEVRKRVERFMQERPQEGSKGRD